MCVFVSVFGSAVTFGQSQQRRPVMTGLGTREPGLGLAELGPNLVQ